MVRLTGKQTSYTQKLEKSFGIGKKELEDDVGKLLPQALLTKIRRRKLVRTTQEEEEISGRIYKMM